MDETLMKISLNGQAFYIFANMENGIELTVTNGSESFYGKASKDEIIEMANLADIDEGRYCELLRECMCGIKVKNVFSYQLVEESEQSYGFIWKQLLDGGIKFQLGALTLQKDISTNKLSIIFDSLVKQLTTLKSSVSKLEVTNTNLQSEKESMLKKMTGYAKAKESLEEELYTKFCLVLNEKKARIRQLKSQVESQDHARSLEKGSGGTVDHTASDTDEIDTDEENETKKDRPVKGSRENIILDEQINISEDKPKKNRKRIRASKPKTPVGASIVPRTSSLPRPKRLASEERNNAMKKMKSKEVSAEDLLEMI